MINAGTIAEIIATYKKHGWVLRRVLLSGDAIKLLQPQLSVIAPDVLVLDSDIDAAWFSRPPTGGGVAWELRYLGDTPFALLENIDESSSTFEDDLRRVEARLQDTVAKKKSA